MEDNPQIEKLITTIMASSILLSVTILGSSVIIAITTTFI